MPAGSGLRRGTHHRHEGATKRPRHQGRYRAAVERSNQSPESATGRSKKARQAGWRTTRGYLSTEVT